MSILDSNQGILMESGTKPTTSEEAVELLNIWVKDEANNRDIRKRCALYEFGVEKKLGKHLVE